MRNSRRLPLVLAAGAALALAAVVSLLAVGSPNVRSQTPPLSEDEAALLALINDYRAKNGLSTLKVSRSLSAVIRSSSTRSNSFRGSGQRERSVLDTDSGQNICFTLRFLTGH